MKPSDFSWICLTAVVLMLAVNSSKSQDPCSDDKDAPKCIIESYTIRGDSVKGGASILFPSVAFDNCSDLIALEFFQVEKGAQIDQNDFLECGSHSIQGLFMDQNQNLSLCEFIVTIDCKAGTVSEKTQLLNGHQMADLGLKHERFDQYRIMDFELGSLSAIWESGKRGPGAISIGTFDPGGISYGIYQLSSKHGYLDDFLNREGVKYKERLGAYEPGTTAFNDIWIQIAKEDPSGFRNAQHDFIKRTHYDLYAERVLRQIGFDINRYSKVVKDVLWSTAVQHGPYNNIIKHAFRGRDHSRLSEKDIIEMVYAERARVREGQLVNFPRVNDRWKKNLIQRFQSEKTVALRRLEAYDEVRDIASSRNYLPMAVQPDLLSNQNPEENLTNPLDSVFSHYFYGYSPETQSQLSEDQIPEPEILKPYGSLAALISNSAVLVENPFPAPALTAGQNEEQIPSAEAKNSPESLSQHHTFRILFTILNSGDVVFPELKSLGNTTVEKSANGNLYKYFLIHEKSTNSVEHVINELKEAGFGAAKIIHGQTNSSDVSYDIQKGIRVN